MVRDFLIFVGCEKLTLACFLTKE